jgi:Na+/H+ antiporter NhaA
VQYISPLCLQPFINYWIFPVYVLANGGQSVSGR